MLGYFQIFVSAPVFGVNIRFWYLWRPVDSVFVYYIGAPPAKIINSIMEYSTVLFAMVGNLRYIPEEQKKLVITMSLSGMRTKGIENATGIKSRTIWRLTNGGSS